jgi:ATP-dependent DNA helicase RecG
MKVPEWVQSSIGAVVSGSPAHSLETERLDFKQLDRDLSKGLMDLAGAAMCFANASGGQLVVGIADRPGGMAALRGCSAAVADIRNGIFERTNPGLVVDVDEYRHTDAPNVRLVIIDIHQGTEVYSVSGRVTVRMGASCKALSPAEVHRLYTSRLNLDLSAASTGLDERAVSASAVDIARRRLRAMPEGGREIADLPLGELLRNLHLVDESGHLRRAGELLLATRPEEADATLVYVHRPQSSAEPDLSTRLSGTLLEVAERAIDLVRARRHERNLLLQSGQQITVADFPEPAVREAIANALVHRDYHLGGSVFVEHNDEQLTVSSPGGFLNGVTPDNVLTGEPRARNPLLAEAARNLRLGERLGIGVDRMYRSMIAAGGHPPTFEDRGDSVQVRFTAAGDTDVARFVAQLPASPDDEHETDVLIVLHELCRRRTISAESLVPVSQRRLDEAQVVLERMASMPLELLEPTRRTARRANPTYRLRDHVLAQLGGAVHYHRRSGDDIDRKVIAHVAEYERVTNATVRNLLDVSVTRASGILRDMVDRGLLLKTSTQQRGKAVEYGPGPDFPGTPVRKPAKKRRSGSPAGSTDDRLFDV